MKSNSQMTWLQFWLRVSRPRFWVYVFGPYLLGWLAAQSVLPPTSFPWLAFGFSLFFLLPANLLIYGVNDIFDYATDKLNPKKQGYEFLVEPSRYGLLWTGIIIFCLPFLLLCLYVPQFAQVGLFGFLFFALFYSAPPIRAKTKPLLDSVFNILYVFPAVVGYYIAGGTNISYSALIAAGLWTMAMHAFSAVPDITADQAAHLNTIATLLQKRGTLLFCLLCYVAATLLANLSLGPVAYLLGTPYMIIMTMALATKNDTRLFALYRWFPKLNTLVGFALFWIIVWLKS
jgi:4-hydroxybenzoate polyprenyltransferase